MENVPSHFYPVICFSRSEYGAFWKCIQAGVIYAVTQLCKMLVLATFFPDTNLTGSGGFDVIGVR